MPSTISKLTDAGLCDGVGTCKYNGFTFPNQISAKGSSRAVPNASGRATKYVEHTLTIEFVITNDMYIVSPGPGTSVDDNYQEIRRTLTQQGGELIFEEKGFGNTFKINTTQEDVAFGPKPDILSWESIGSNRAIRCVWTVSVQIAEPVGGQSSRSQFRERFAEAEYSMSWGIQSNGLTRRTITGSVEIPMARLTETSTEIMDTVDRYRERLNIPVPLAFEREQDWGISLDRRTLNFTIVDNEIPSDNPYFPGVIRISCPYRVSNTNRSMKMWNISLSGSIEVAMGVPKWFAWAAFVMVVKQKRKQQALASVSDSKGQKKRAGYMWTHTLSIEEDVYSRSLSFDVGWIHQSDLSEVFKSTDFFQLVDGTTWDGWRNSMIAGTNNWTQRGHAGMSHQISDDNIMRLTGGTQNFAINNITRRGGVFSSEELFTQPCPPKSSSWLVFKNEIDLIRDSNTIAHYPLQPPESFVPVAPKPEDDSTSTSGSAIKPPVVQRRTQSNYRIRVHGYAIRVCYEIPQIQIGQTYKGVKVSCIDKPKQTIRKLADYDHPIWISRWDFMCQLSGKPSSIEEPDDLIADTFAGAH